MWENLFSPHADGGVEITLSRMKPKGEEVNGKGIRTE